MLQLVLGGDKLKHVPLRGASCAAHPARRILRGASCAALFEVPKVVLRPCGANFRPRAVFI